MIDKRVLTTAGILFAFIALEYILPNFTKHKNPFKRKYFYEDLLFLTVSGLLGALLPAVGLKYLFLYRQDLPLLNGFEYVKNMSWGWQFFWAFILKDFFGYWMHRFSHTPILWRFHMVHHEIDCMDATSSSRVHPFNLIFISLRTPGLLIFGFDKSVLPIMGLSQFVHNFFVHMNVKINFGFLNHIFISPHLHRFHHAAESKYHHKNFGVYLSIWDQLFGTFFNAPNNLEVELGVKGRVRKSFIPTIIEPFIPQFALTKFENWKKNKVQFKKPLMEDLQQVEHF